MYVPFSQIDLSHNHQNLIKWKHLIKLLQQFKQNYLIFLKIFKYKICNCGNRKHLKNSIFPKDFPEALKYSIYCLIEKIEISRNI